VRFVNAEGQKSPFSNFIFFEPISNAAKSPILAAPVATQTSVNLLWLPPQENIDATAPANIIGYNLYRKSKQNEKPLLLNNSLLAQTEFEDKTFKFGENYEYFVRTISAGSNGIQIESINSNLVSITPQDIFPPSAPEGFTIAAAPGNLSVFFAASAEPDVIGYNIFRTTKPELPPEQWQKLNDAPISAASFQDTKVESGQKYFYFVVAIDSAGNVSRKSETVSEAAP
jgi:fibronectin type 3 domain-containing protein